MAPRSSILRVTGCALALALILCPVNTFRRLHVTQADEDLTFDDDEDAVASRYRREVLRPDSNYYNNNNKKRQISLGLQDDEDLEGSGFPLANIQTYRIKFLRDEAFSSKLADRTSPEFSSLKLLLENKFSSLFEIVPPGEVSVHVASIGSGAQGKQEVLLDITHRPEEGSTSSSGPRIQMIMENALSSKYQSAVPGSLVFDEIEDRSGSRCQLNEELCPEGTCVPRCDGTPQCLSGADELNCPLTSEAPIFTEDKVVVEAEINTDTDYTDVEIDDVCPGDDKFSCQISFGPPYNKPTKKIICAIQRCDLEVDCPNGDDEDGSSCGPPKCSESLEIECDGKCLPLSKTCDGHRDCSDGRDEVAKYCVPVVTDCKDDEFKCNDGSCVASFRRCDFAQDCPNNEDEEFCPCNPPNYMCLSGQCIKESKRCDGFDDCDDGSDENVGCSDSEACEGSGEFVCDDGDTCLDINKLCDGARDCDDGTDESSPDCGTKAPPVIPEVIVPPADRICPPGHHKCGDGTCIEIDFKCDGKNDCRDESDETGCVSSCAIDQFRCDDGNCVGVEKRCNGVFDCYKGEDEKSCCKKHEFRCSAGGHCIDIKYRCNKQVDCPFDESDEDGCSPSSCRADQFKCSNGLCISASKKCDSVDDCHDGSDEQNCPPASKLCLEEEFQCTNGQCIPIGYTCDGLPDCNDGSDEMQPACKTQPGECSETEFQCSSGDCIDIARRCDQSLDCLDESDERGCPATRECTPDEFKCGDDSCISKTWRCDQVADCVDGSDEVGCTCKGNEFSCGNGQCIPESLLCDANFDCPDGSDEKSCRICEDNDFVCANKDCIPQEKRCDSVQDCSDGSDEIECGESDYVEACSENEFKCKSGECVASDAVCDFKNDCRDRSDEENCDKPSLADRLPTTTTPRFIPITCSPNYFECQNGQCISNNKRCDANFDCADLSDEIDCPPPTCSAREFTCHDGECIPIAHHCDGNYDCPDASDERGCSDESLGFDKCGSFEFTCRSGECISQATVCDGTGDCLDNSDETNCPGRTGKACEEREFSCGDGSCISQLAFCDGRFDCRDGSDESNCIGSRRQCRKDEFNCDDGQCISALVRCDGRSDCLDSSDERFCPKVTPRTVKINKIIV